MQGAREYLRSSLELAQANQNKMDILLAMKAISAYFVAKDDDVKALELITLINHHPATSQWAKDRSAQLAERLEAELPPEDVVAAKESGQARDLDATVVELLETLGN
jgi:hypothetical protein